ncbi:MAG: tetratricopeptide repeat protein, partial [Terriglobia bacterium]
MIAHSLIVLFLAACASPATQTAPGATSPESQVRKLYGEKRYADIIRLPPPVAHDSTDLDYFRGMAFAKLKRWTEAWNALRRGELKDPHDERFAVELAGVDFELKHYRRARAELHRALRVSPKDTYANNFLASLYYLDGNLAAALKYWNRVGKPRVRQVRTDPQPKLKPVLFNSALAFARGEILTLPEYRATQERIQALGVFPQFRLELVPNAGQEYSAKIHPLELNGWGDSTAEGLISVLRGVPYETVYPEVFNIHHSAVNLVSMLRWDPNKQRVFAALSGPLAGSARSRYQFYLDGRKENWDISHTFFAAASPLTDLRLKKIEGGAEMMTLVNHRLALRGGVDLSARSFTNFNTAQPVAAPFFANGLALEAETSARYRLADFPDRRFTLDSTGSIQAGHDFARTLGNFAQAEGGLAADWLPQASA